MTSDERDRHDMAVDYFEAIGIWQAGMVLHHLDTTLKQRDPARYHEWRVEDLRPMSIASHNSLHMALRIPKGSRKTASHIRAMVAGKRKERRRCNVLIHRVVSGNVAEGIEAYVYPSCSAAARHIGCSKQLVYQVASKTQHNRRACGWICNYVPKSVSLGKVAGDMLKSLVG
jgi:hypothetical protein|nr:MAG TPA: hypothetical protein [Caudoviricetes sp.]